MDNSSIEYKLQQRQIITTSDGSNSLYLPELDENYHSTHGAVQESMHVFIKCGLQFLNLSSVKIFEMGFGTGLNAILTYLYHNKSNISYRAIEAYPIKQALMEKLNYPSFLKMDKDQTEAFRLIHKSEPDKEIQLNKNFNFKKQHTSVISYPLSEKFNLIYFDAFAPEIQPNLWSKEIFKKMHAMLHKNGVLVTYCSKGQVRRNMQLAGFRVDKLPGPPGKREIVRATKCN